MNQSQNDQGSIKHSTYSLSSHLHYHPKQCCKLILRLLSLFIKLYKCLLSIIKWTSRYQAVLQYPHKKTIQNKPSLDAWMFCPSVLYLFKLRSGKPGPHLHSLVHFWADSSTSDDQYLSKKSKSSINH